MDSQNININDFHEHMYSNISLLKIHNTQNQSNILSQYQSQESYKTLYDPIHKYITFPEKMWEIIDTPEFQRLRRLKQLSTTSFIYLGANHTRFEHCIGTGFLSRDLVKKGFKSLNTENTNNHKNSIKSNSSYDKSLQQSPKISTGKYRPLSSKPKPFSLIDFDDKKIIAKGTNIPMQRKRYTEKELLTIIKIYKNLRVQNIFMKIINTK